MNIIPLGNNVVVTDFKKGERSVGGIIFADDNGKSHGIRPRWAKVAFVKEGFTDIKVGEWVYIKHGRWSRPIHKDDDGKQYYCAEIDSILLVSEEEPEDTIVVETRVYQ